MNLEQFSDSELQQELTKRAQKKAFDEKKALKAREIKIDCPACGGNGQVKNQDTMRVASGEADPYSPCPICKGKGTIIAYRSKS